MGISLKRFQVNSVMMALSTYNLHTIVVGSSMMHVFTQFVLSTTLKKHWQRHLLTAMQVHHQRVSKNLCTQKTAQMVRAQDEELQKARLRVLQAEASCACSV